VKTRRFASSSSWIDGSRLMERLSGARWRKLALAERTDFSH